MCAPLLLGRRAMLWCSLWVLLAVLRLRGLGIRLRWAIWLLRWLRLLGRVGLRRIIRMVRLRCYSRMMLRLRVVWLALLRVPLLLLLLWGVGSLMGLMSRIGRRWLLSVGGLWCWLLWTITIGLRRLMIASTITRMRCASAPAPMPAAM